MISDIKHFKYSLSSANNKSYQPIHSSQYSITHVLECHSCATLIKERTQFDRELLTLSSTLRHLSAPHKDATRFSLSSSWLRFCTHSFTVATHTHKERDRESIAVTSDLQSDQFFAHHAFSSAETKRPTSA